ncbi:uncharacterized protein [Engystomops pustulosus]|uniref:uncharacterized protein n=1 Tax=Engystomops pustulosus TaxID=76066 RepID=UPI003AFB6F9F
MFLLTDIRGTGSKYYVIYHRQIVFLTRYNRNMDTVNTAFENVDNSTRRNRAAEIFSKQGTENSSVRFLMQELEIQMSDQVKIWWDYTTLQSYLERAMIPRGLRIKKLPTVVYNDDFSKQWNQILSECSLNLMKLIISMEKEKLSAIEGDIAKIRESLKPHIDKQEFKDLDVKLKENIADMENAITQIKQNKFNRDLRDYEKDCVYTWHAYRRHGRTTSSILRNSNRRKYSHNTSKVGFTSSEQESTDVVSEDSDSEGATATNYTRQTHKSEQTKNYKTQQQQKNPKNPLQKNAQDGQEKDTTTQYNTRATNSNNKKRKN